MTSGVANPAGGYGFSYAARMEWIKLRTLRSTTWSLLAVVVGMITVGVLTMANTDAPVTAAQKASFDPVNSVLAGVAIGQLIVGVLGVLIVTSEYSSGMIRSTLAAIPNRRLLLAAKAAVFGAIAIAVGEAITFVTFFAGRAMLTSEAPLSLGDLAVLRAVLLSGAYMGIVGLIGVGLGAITRHTAGAIGALVGITYVLPAALSGLTGVSIAKFFPTMIAGNSLAVAKPEADMLSPWAGFGMLILYVAATLGAGVWVLARRDA